MFIWESFNPQKFSAIIGSWFYMNVIRIHEEGAMSSDAAVVPGFQDFTESKQRKKRQQPSIPIKPREQLLSLEDGNYSMVLLLLISFLF